MQGTSDLVLRQILAGASLCRDAPEMPPSTADAQRLQRVAATSGLHEVPGLALSPLGRCRPCACGTVLGGLPSPSGGPVPGRRAGGSSTGCSFPGGQHQHQHGPATDSSGADSSEDRGDTDRGHQRLGQPVAASGGSLTKYLVCSVLTAAVALDQRPLEAWHSVVRHMRLDFAEVCCSSDSALSASSSEKGGHCERFNHWNGYDLTTQKGAERLKERLAECWPRVVWMSPPCGPDSPIQNLNQRTPAQKEAIILN